MDINAYSSFVADLGQNSNIVYDILLCILIHNRMDINKYRLILPTQCHMSRICVVSA